MVRLAVVGLGFGGGQLTLAGHRALAESAWIAWYGLPAELKTFVSGYVGAVQVDIDLLLRSDIDPSGFVARMTELAVDAAFRFGTAAIAVAGHPSCSNRAVPVLSVVWIHGRVHGVGRHARIGPRRIPKPCRCCANAHGGEQLCQLT